ncbi:MAG: hypothetical protein K9H16_07585 [Bacteroidales bacterium]|nr:hypothetical protein [Bacteroidales bacterium]
MKTLIKIVATLITITLLTINFSLAQTPPPPNGGGDPEQCKSEGRQKNHKAGFKWLSYLKKIQCGTKSDRFGQ